MGDFGQAVNPAAIRLVTQAALAFHFLNLGHFDIAAIMDFITQPLEALLQAGIPHRTWPHIDAAPLLAQVHRHAKNAHHRAVL
jgi:hypothetical protein